MRIVALGDHCGKHSKILIQPRRIRAGSVLFLGSIAFLCASVVLRLQAIVLESPSSHPAIFDHYERPNYERYDRRSEFSIMKTDGRHSDDERTSRRKGLVLDALSIGTQFNLGLLEAQQQTWASAKSIRHYFAATELDDADPTCYKTLNMTTITDIRKWCTQKKPYAKGAMRLQFEQFHNGGTEKNRGAGWMCAQQRFAVALEKLGLFYRNKPDDSPLPDFLLMQDDDTYYNMAKMEEFLRDKDPSVPLAEAPCLVRYMSSRNFSYPWGGYGFILSRGAIANLIRPIHCNSTSSELLEGFQHDVCSRLEDDMTGERRFFLDGMSVSDLMGAQVRNNLFTKFTKGNWSYCLHGDWALGYYVNFYNISNHIKKDWRFKRIPEVRIESTLGGTAKKDRGNCKYKDVQSCTVDAHVCHRQTAQSMSSRKNEVAAKHPGVFRNRDNR